MKTCYNCGKIIFSNKVFGQIGNNMYTFCSDKCRTATWNKIGVKGDDSMDFSSADADDDTGYRHETKESGAKAGAPSKMEIVNAEYSYSARTDRVTLKIGALRNRSGEKTGSIRFELFMSKTGPFSPGTKLSGYTMAVTSVYEPLRVNSAYSNVTSTMRPIEKKSGTYRPVLFVRELNEDGDWKLTAYVNFSAPEKIL